MPLGWKNSLVRLPEIAVAATAAVRIGNRLPQTPAGSLRMVANDKSHNLACAATHRCPQPTLLGSLPDKRPDFIQFQDIIRLGGKQGFPQVR